MYDRNAVLHNWSGGRALENSETKKEKNTQLTLCWVKCCFCFGGKYVTTLPAIILHTHTQKPASPLLYVCRFDVCTRLYIFPWPYLFYVIYTKYYIKIYFEALSGLEGWLWSLAHRCLFSTSSLSDFVSVSQGCDLRCVWMYGYGSAQLNVYVYCVWRVHTPDVYYLSVWQLSGV